MPHLFEEFTLRGVKLRNRVGVSPMCQYWSEDGMASDWHLVHLGARAVGGAALVIYEATAVEARGRITPGDAGIWSDAHIEPLARINRFIKQYGAVPGIQLAHAGRKASTAPPFATHGDHDRSLSDAEGGWEIVGPSPLPFRNGSRVPKELTQAEIKEIQQAFRAATLRATEAEYQWLELHAAHGYLAHSFHSPLSNHRQDEYGGSFENRIRFTMETVRAIREVWSEEYPLSVRLSCTDWVEGGWTLEESIELSKKLKTEGVDLIDCSSGFGVPGVRYPIEPDWQVPFAEAIRKQANIPTAAVGMITEPQQADRIIREGQADIVLLATEMLRDPYWPFHAARSLHPTQTIIQLPAPYDYVLQR